MKKLQAFFIITISLVLISFAQGSWAAETTCEDVCDALGWQYNVYECVDDFEGSCSDYPKFDGNYCYYDCQTASAGVFDVADCDSNTCICIKKTKCDSSENNCYDQEGCVSCQGRKSAAYGFTGSCEVSADCCQQPDALSCDSETNLCYDPNNNFSCISHRKCYSDEECMSNTCDINGTGECECSDRGKMCQSSSDCQSGLRCNNDYDVCYDPDIKNLAAGEICYYYRECESRECDFNAQGTLANQGKCKGEEGYVPPEEEPEENGGAEGPSKPPQGTSVCDDYCYYKIKPPEGTVCICNPLPSQTFEEVINSIIDFIFKISIVVAPLMIVWAGGLYITSAGSEDKIRTARNIIVYALSGLAVVLLAKGLVAIIIQILAG